MFPNRHGLMGSSHSAEAIDTERPAAPLAQVAGWNFLRGWCAVAVAAYHLLLWQDVAELHVLGSYGVYLFFVLSGASLAYTYGGAFERGQFAWPGFLWLRYWRLAPLYLALMLVALPWKLAQGGASADLAALYASNALFVFGFFQPSTHAVLVGGWSLGIEAIFYLLFPLALWCLRSWRLAALVFAALLAVQAAWIYATVAAPGPAAADWPAYHHAPAFAAYFFGGCMLGAWHRTRSLGVFASTARGLGVLVLGFALMVAANPAVSGQQLVGWRGVGLCALCFAMVWAASRLALGQRLSALATHLGDSTYGLYLLHPVLFFTLAWVVFPRLHIDPPGQWSVAGRCGFAVAVIIVSQVLALGSDRWLEQPVRRWSKRRLQQRQHARAAAPAAR